ncbi:MAG: SMI1/KNR4 family protein [Bacteroidia bacterium]|nr:SMI1/KNR4 family protein [Bacteroidia bacterium]
MAEGLSQAVSLPQVFFDWLATVQRFPMFSVWRDGTLCSIKLTHILDLSNTDRNIFIHRSRLAGLFPDAFLPLGYDVFGNLLLWDVERDEVYIHWRGMPPEHRIKVASSLEHFCDKLYYRPIQG